MTIDEATRIAQLEAELAALRAREAALTRELERRDKSITEAMDRQAAIAEILRILASTPTEPEPVLQSIIDTAARLCHAPSGALVQNRERDGRLAARARTGLTRAWAAGREDLTFDAWVGLATTRGTVQGRAFVDQRTIHVADYDEVAEAYVEGAASRAESSFDWKSQISVPLLRGGEAIGVLTLHRQEVWPDAEREIAILEAFADQAVIAIELARLFHELAGLNRTLETRVRDQVDELERVGRLRRYLSPQLADLIVSSGDESMLEHHRRQITVVFCDVRGFTAFAETAEPEEVMGVIAEYFETLGALVRHDEGTLDHFAGDGLMVFFNDPLPQPDHAERAVRMACAMRERVNDLARGWRRAGYELDFGVGIATGYATLGRIGFEGRYDYTANGTVVNLAARLCSEANGGQILVSGRLHGMVADIVDVERVGDLVLKGLHRPVEAFNITSVRQREPIDQVSINDGP